ncbi:MAG: SDR family NAD(P)-dependent oxidoreductase [Chloroflexi bacterium]|nr:SDR family NAD(P)-dependent oxidoreductase [Chloroflexota bacterium]
MEAIQRHLSGKVVWVTGSSRGLGRAIAGHLAACGANLVVHGTHPTSTRAFGEADSLQAVADEIAAASQVETLAVSGNLAVESEVERMLGEIHARFERIDILVNCAGGDIGAAGTSAPNAGKPAANDAVGISYQDLVTVLERNLMTCILTCRAVAPEMMARHAGRIINIGSIAGLVGVEQSAIYATAKAAVHEYSRCLAALLRPYNIAVNVIAPGDTVTQRFLHSRVIDESKMIDDDTLIRYGQPIEVAHAVEFLVADSTTYISGQVLRVDGGKQAWPA